MRVGFTGTQRGMTAKQMLRIKQHLELLSPTEVHHGDCVGADKQFHEIAKSLGLYTVIHPPENNKKRAFCSGDSSYPTKPYLERNHHIASITDVLFATPAQYSQKLRSGTWATVRYAKKKGKGCLIFFPDGTLG